MELVPAVLKMRKIRVEIEFTEDVLGTVPKDKSVYATYIESKREDIAEPSDVEADTVPSTEEKGWTGFHRDDRGIFAYDYQIRGFLKEAANTLKDQLGVKNMKSKMSNLAYVKPRRIYFLSPDGDYKASGDGVNERPLRAETAQGPRVALARSDFAAAGSKMIFTIEALDSKEITPQNIATLLSFGELRGLGQWRTGSYGRFKVNSCNLED